MGRISSVVVALLLLLVELVVGVRLSLLDGPVRKRVVSQALPKDLEQYRSVPTHPKLKKKKVKKNSRKGFVTAERHSDIPHF